DLDMSCQGQEHSVIVPGPNGKCPEANREEMIARFHHLHEHHYTFKLHDTKTEVADIHITGFGQVGKINPIEIRENLNSKVDLLEKIYLYVEEVDEIKTPIYIRNNMGKNMFVQGQAIIEEKQTSTLLYPNQTLRVDKYGNLIIETEV